MEAKILYDYEIEEMSKENGLSIIPLLGYLYENFPRARFEDLLYTASEHVRSYGLNSDYPTEIQRVPAPLDTLESDNVDSGLPEPRLEEEIEEITGEMNHDEVVLPPRRRAQSNNISVSPTLLNDLNLFSGAKRKNK